VTRSLEVRSAISSPPREFLRQKIGSPGDGGRLSCRTSRMPKFD